MAPRLSGWLWNGERLVTDDRVEGALARGMAVLGGCRERPECTRHVRLDLQQLTYHGLGKAPLSEVRRRYECGRLPKCEMAMDGLRQTLVVGPGDVAKTEKPTLPAASIT